MPRGATSKIGRTANVIAGQAIRAPGEHLLPPTGCTAAYKREWEKIVHDLNPEHFRESDRTVLEAYIDMSLMLKDMRAAMDKEPYMVETVQGVKENPLLGSIVKFTGRMLTMANALRLVPSSRLQTSTTQKGPGLLQAKAHPKAGQDETGGLRMTG